MAMRNRKEERAMAPSAYRSGTVRNSSNLKSSSFKSRLPPSYRSTTRDLRFGGAVYLHLERPPMPRTMESSDSSGGEVHQRKKLEEEMITLRSQLLPLTFEAHQMRQCLGRGGFGNGYVGLGSPMSQVNHSHFRDSGDRQKTPVASFFEQVELQKILSLLELDDVNVKIHAVKVVANLAAVESNKARIVEVDGLDSLLMLLSSSNDETICRVVAGAIANLAMNGQSKTHNGARWNHFVI